LKFRVTINGKDKFMELPVEDASEKHSILAVVPQTAFSEMGTAINKQSCFNARHALQSTFQKLCSGSIDEAFYIDWIWVAYDHRVEVVIEKKKRFPTLDRIR